MARLRREEESRAYERMLRPHSPPQAPAQRAYEAAFEVPLSNEEDDEVTYAEINRQLALIVNVLVSIVACSVTIWVAARHWSTPHRLGLSLSGAAIVAVAEVVVYNGYLRRVKEAKQREKKRPERKEISETWVIGSADKNQSVPVATSLSKENPSDSSRQRKGTRK